MDTIISALFRASRKNDIVSLNVILGRNPQLIDMKGDHGNTFLMIASRYHSYEAIELLTDLGADVNALFTRIAVVNCSSAWRTSFITAA